MAAGLQSEGDDPVSINVWRPVETVLTSAARLAWPAFQAVNRRLESAIGLMERVRDRTGES